MKRTLLGCLLALLCVAPGRTADPLVVNLWPGKAPGESTDVGQEKTTNKKDHIEVTNIARPTLLVYRPDKDKNTGTALIIAPGGAYQFLSIDMEGENVAKWCSSLGVTGIVLKYRVPRRKDNPLAAFQDGQRAVSLVRDKAFEWGVDPNRIGMIGFSAGGGVTNDVLLNPTHRSYETVDGADKVSSRLNYAALTYAAGGLGGKSGKGGKNELDEGTVNKDNLPPVFLVAAYDDGLSQGAAQTFLTLKKAGIRAELHIYAAGGHGFGMRASNNPLIADWSNRLEAWLRYQKLLDKKTR
jgi:acetyl esterase/lipase